MFDEHKNFAYSTVAVPPSNTNTLQVVAGEASRFPTPPFNATIWPSSVIPTVNNATIVRVTAISGDQFTFTRAQEGSNDRNIQPFDQILAGITKKTLDDIEANAQGRPVFDVQEYGAVFDGVTDDTAAIQAAIDAANSAGGGVVEMPYGIARTSGVLTTYPDMWLRGQGMNATILQTLTTSGALPGGAMIKPSTSTDDYTTFSDFKLLGHGEDETSGTGILYDTGLHSFVKMSRLWIEGFPDDGIYMDTPILTSLEDLRLRHNGRDGLFIDGGTTVYLKTIYATGNDRSGIHLDTVVTATIDNTVYEYNSYGLWLQSCSSITVTAPYGEIAMDAGNSDSNIIAFYRLQSSNNIVVNTAYSSKFAYLHDLPAYHWYITGSKRVILNNVRGKAPLGGADPGEIPTGTIFMNSTSEVTANNIIFEDKLGGGQSGNYTNEVFSGGESVEVTTTQQDMVEGRGYIPNSSSMVLFSLPRTARVGRKIEIAGYGSGGWRLSHGVGKIIHFNLTDSSSSLGGALESTNRYDTIKLICTVTDEEWVVTSSIGTLTSRNGATTTFGKATNGTSSASSTALKLVLSKFTATQTGILSKGTARVWVDGGSVASKYCIFSDNAGSVNYKLAESDITNITGTVEAEVDYTFSNSQEITVVNGTTYWIGLAWNLPSPQTVTISRDSTASGRVSYDNTYTWPNVPFEPGTPTTTSTGILDSYVTIIETD